MVRVLVVAVLLVLAGCTSSVSGSPAPTEAELPPVEPGSLRFRHVLQTTTVEPGDPPADLAALREVRQPTRPTEQAILAGLAALDCTAPDPLAGEDDEARPLMACDSTTGAAYALGPSFLTGADIEAAAAELTENGYVVNIDFTSAGTRTWAEYTEASVGQQVAMLLDTDVLTAPAINEPITDGATQIAGGQNGFTREEAELLAARITASN